jgi:integrase
LLRKLQRIVERNHGTFHTELHQLRKTAATRWRRGGMEIEDVARQLGHMKKNGRPNVEQTMTYLADIPHEELTKIVAAAMYHPKPQIVKKG